MEDIKTLKGLIESGFIKDDFFTGPASYFPHMALEYRKRNFLSDRHIEMIYATLTAWGMHRLSKTGPKLPDFKHFKCHILHCKNELNKLKDVRIEDVPEGQKDSLFSELKELVFNKIHASETNSQIVASTKTLAHILPDLIPPMDREYTAKFFGINIDTNQGKETLFLVVMATMWRIYQTDEVRKKALAYNKNHPFVSLPKLFDNAIIQIRREEDENAKKGKKGTK